MLSRQTYSVSSVEPPTRIDLRRHPNGGILIHDDEARYFVRGSTFEDTLASQAAFPRQIGQAELTEVDGVLASPWGAKNQAYSAAGSFIFDMQGISSLIFARHMDFSDIDARRLVIALGLVDAERTYLRIGPAGASGCGRHPGGDVVECSLLSGADGSGQSQSVVGFFDAELSGGRSVDMGEPESGRLQEERSVYSQTAWLRSTHPLADESRRISIRQSRGQSSLLDVITELSRQIPLPAYAIQVTIDDPHTEIIGRVARGPAKTAWKTLEDASKAGIELRFRLQPNETMLALGTHFPRWEPDWTEFSGGRTYESRGHFHATIIGRSEASGTLATFHLRDAVIAPESNVSLWLFPVSAAYRVYPLDISTSDLRCAASHRSLAELAGGT